jgi:hypothetical protein
MYESLQFITMVPFGGHGFHAIDIGMVCSPKRVNLQLSHSWETERPPGRHYLHSALTTTADEDAFTSTGCKSADSATDIILTAFSFFRENQGR